MWCCSSFSRWPLEALTPRVSLGSLIDFPAGLIISGCKLDDAQAEQLANALMNNVKITELDVSFNNITAKGGQALLKAVTQNMCSVQEVFAVGNSTFRTCPFGLLDIAPYALTRRARRRPRVCALGYAWLPQEGQPMYVVVVESNFSSVVSWLSRACFLLLTVSPLL